MNGINEKLEEYKDRIIHMAEKYAPMVQEVGSTIWKFAELSMEEYRTSQFLISLMEREGFSVTRGVGGYPTGFLAEYRNGEGPMLGLTCEFDALPGLSSEKEGMPGHGCSHNMFAAGAVTTACLLKDFMTTHHIQGGITLIGAPAEEKYGCKPFYVKQGLLKHIDAFMSFHPLIWNGVFYMKHNASISKQYRFYGQAAHAAVEPEKGKSALSAVEFMNIGCHFLRMHLTKDVRINYIITDGGTATGIIPDYAASSYGIRAQELETLNEIEKRVDTIAEAAAMATGCRVEKSTYMRLVNTLLNYHFSKLAHQNILKVGLPQFDEQDESRLRALGFHQGFSKEIKPLTKEEGFIGGSTDEADLSWTAPWMRLSFASLGMETAGHSKEEDAQSNYPATHKATLQTVKASACTALDILLVPENLVEMKKEHEEKMSGRIYPYEKDIYPNPFHFPNPKGIYLDAKREKISIDLAQTIILANRDKVQIQGYLEDVLLFEKTVEKNAEIGLNQKLQEDKVIKLYYVDNNQPIILGYLK